MTRERFETLAEAYGGDVARWPDAEREAAAEFMAADPAWAERVLAHAEDLDAALAAFSPPRASAGVMDRILAAAPRARPAPGRGLGWLLPAGMGAGLAAVCAAGVMLGARTATPSAPPADAVVTAVSDDEALAYFDEDA